jgi:simple sugar transport system permease protein
VSTDIATVPPPPAQEQPPDTEHLSFGKRLWYAYLYGSTPVLVVLAFLLALVIGAILIAVSDEPTRSAMGYFTQHPGDTFTRGWHAIASAYSQLFEGSIFNPNSLYSNSGIAVLNPISDTLTNATPLILTGLAVGLAFRAGLFNIGGQGQIVAGAICAGYVGFAWSLPPGLHVIVAVLAGAIGGAIWGGIAGLLKAATGAHEVITTIMLNYVAFYLLSYLLGLGGFQKPNSNEAISLAAAVVCWWLLSRSTLGFRLRAVGANHLAARTAGMSVANSYLVVMLIAGALAGLAGATQVMGVNTSLNQSIDAGVGFDAITVALLGFASPGGIVAAGLLFGAFRAGSVQLLVNTTTPQEIVDIIQAVIVLFIAAPGLIRTIYRLRAARAGHSAAQLAKGWNG